VKLIDKTIFRSPVKSTEGKTVHLYQQQPGVKTSFDPDVQEAMHVVFDTYRKGSPFVCGRTYRGEIDLITHDPKKSNCLKCLNVG
jgi:hypothetical protein